jgi:hypothetical protein
MDSLGSGWCPVALVNTVLNIQGYCLLKQDTLGSGRSLPTFLGFVVSIMMPLKVIVFQDVMTCNLIKVA